MINFHNKIVPEMHLYRSVPAPNYEKHGQYNLKLPSCDWFGTQLRRSRHLRLCWHLLVIAGIAYLSIQSLVPVIKFRCHFFVAHSTYPSFWALGLKVDTTKENRGTAHWPSCWLLLAMLLVLEMFCFSCTSPRKMEVVWYRSLAGEGPVLQLSPAAESKELKMSILNYKIMF